VLYSSVYNLFALIGRKAPFTHSLSLNMYINIDQSYYNLNKALKRHVKTINMLVNPFFTLIICSKLHWFNFSYVCTGNLTGRDIFITYSELYVVNCYRHHLWLVIWFMTKKWGEQWSFYLDLSKNLNCIWLRPVIQYTSNNCSNCDVINALSNIIFIKTATASLL